MSTQALAALPRRRERHFGDRVVWCFEDRLRSVYAAFERAAQAHAPTVALRFGDQAWTYRQAEAEVGRIAAGLQRLGVQAGDRVGLQVRNRPAFVFIFLAIQRLAAVAVPMDVRLRGDEVGHALADAGARVHLYDREMVDRLPQASTRAPDTVCVLVPEPGEGELFPQAREADAPPPTDVADEEALAMILYTSGTTGKPKGAALAHLNVVHSLMHHAGNLGLGPDDRSVVAVPLSHVTGVMCGVLAPLCTGGTLVLLPHFKAREFLPLAAEVRMTYTIMVPAMYNLCLREEAFDRVDLSSWRIGHFGGSPMPQATIDLLARKLPGLQLVNGYGATELCSPATMWPVGGERAPIESVGRALPCVEILVMDPQTGVEVPPGESGELWIRGPMVVQSYWNNPAASAEGIVAGYWRSGDIGRVDTDGYVYVNDRLKDLINRGGYKIYSAEVENVLLQCPGVVEVAVVAKADPVLGERVHAFVATAGTADEAGLQAFCAEHLADYKVPESWTVGAMALPRTTSGKLDKKELRARLAGACA